MLISIHDKSLKRVAFLDNDKPGTLHYRDDTWHRYLTEATSTFDFTVPKPQKPHPNMAFLTEKNYISFHYENADYLFNIMKTVETETALTCSCENLNLELLNETDRAHEAAGAKTFAQYLTVCGIQFARLTLGVNEISDRSRTLSWDGQDTKLARLLSIVKQFDAECEFVTKLNRDGSLDKIQLNVYKSHDANNQGVGNRRSDVTLYYGKEIKSVRRTVDKTGLYTAIRPTGKDGLTVASLPEKKEYDASGRLLFVKPSGDTHILCPSMMAEYPAQFLDAGSDKYINLDWSYDTDNINTLYAKALDKMRSIYQPAITYEAEGSLALDIGDTVIIHDAKFTPTLLLEARVSEQEVSFSDPTKNKNVFANFRALESKLSIDISTRLNQIVEDALPYTAEVLSSAGLVFKNRQGSTMLSPRITKGQKDVTAQVVTTWQKNGMPTGISGPITIFATDIADKAVYRVVASGNDGAVLCSAEVTVSNVNDGSDADVTELEGRMSVAESKLTPDGLTTAISAAVTGGHEIITPNFVMDETGMVINGGGLKIKNNAGMTVLSADATGNLTFRGNLEMQGAQVMRVNNASGTMVGNITFRTIPGENWSPGALQLHGYDFVSLEAGDAETTKAIGQIRAGDEIVGVFGHETSNGVKKYFFGFGQYGADLAYEETVESSGTIKTAVTYKGVNLNEVSGKFVLLSSTNSNLYVSARITPSDYKSFLLMTGTSGRFRSLASLLIPYDAFLESNSDGARSEVAYPGEPGTYMSYCFYSGGYLYLKCKNSTYGAARLYGIT